ncbi:MAG: hypothetical protein ACXIVG_11470 [Pararhodobacter sp.]
MTALKRGFWLAVFGPLLALPFLRRTLWDRAPDQPTKTEAAK